MTSINKIRFVTDNVYQGIAVPDLDNKVKSDVSEENENQLCFSVQKLFNEIIIITSSENNYFIKNTFVVFDLSIKESYRK